MGRQLRFDPPGGFHHVMHRGSRRQLIFEDDDDRREFLKRLGATPQRSGIRVHAYALMPNHYHLLVECPSGGLSTAMKQLNSAYAQWFNWRHSYDGHLFRGRFRSILIGEDSYLVEVARYIHRNSLSAGIVTHPLLDPWNSHHDYLGASTQPWLDAERVLSYFGQDRKRFADFVEAPDSAGARTVLEALDAQRPAVGSQTFLDELKQGVVDRPATAASQRRLLPVDIEHLARTSAPNVRSQHILLAAARRSGASFRSIATQFGIERESTVRSCVHRVERRAQANPKVERMIVDAMYRRTA